MPKLSIIVPIYNSEKYLKECLDSLVNQTFKDIEIICVNDGSTDGSLNIIKHFAQNDSRIKIINQENKGQSAARNAGLKIARSEWVTFIDSDDYIDLNTYERALAVSNIDIICFGDRNESKKSRFYNKNYTIDTNILVLNASSFVGKHTELKFRGALIANYLNLRIDDFTYLIGIDSSCVYVDNINEAKLTVRPSDNANINITNFIAGSISIVNAKKLHSVLFKGIEESVLKFENINFNTVREGIVSFEKCESSVIICNNCKGKIRFSECSRILLFVNDNVYLIEESELVVGRAKNNRRIEYEVDTETGKIYNE